MDELSLRAIAARQEEKTFAAFVRENRRFILACAYRSVGHYVTESDDEWSVALIAFHEAVQSYEPSKGEFAAFAAVVIRRRLTDHLRREGRHSAEIPVSSEVLAGEYEEDEAAGGSQAQIAGELRRTGGLESEGEPAGAALREEIEAVQERLDAYGFSFYDLTECSPRSAKTRKACAEAVAAILGEPELYERMQSSGALPLRELCDRTGLVRKVLERHRRYIIAAVEILHGEYPRLAAYMDGIRKALRAQGGTE